MCTPRAHHSSLHEAPLKTLHPLSVQPQKPEQCPSYFTQENKVPACNKATKPAQAESKGSVGSLGCLKSAKHAQFSIREDVLEATINFPPLY